MRPQTENEPRHKKVSAIDFYLRHPLPHKVLFFVQPGFGILLQTFFQWCFDLKQNDTPALNNNTVNGPRLGYLQYLETETRQRLNIPYGSQHELTNDCVNLQIKWYKLQHSPSLFNPRVEDKVCCPKKDKEREGERVLIWMLSTICQVGSVVSKFVPGTVGYLLFRVYVVCINFKIWAITWSRSPWS